MHGGYSETSEGYDLSVSDYTEIRKQQKKRENTQDILSYLDGKKTKVCSIIDKILDALDDDEKLRQSAPSQITTSLGILIDKFSAVSKISKDSEAADDALTKALKEEAEHMQNADKP